MEKKEVDNEKEKDSRYKNASNEFIFVLKDGLFRAFEAAYICAFLPVKFMKIPDTTYYLTAPSNVSMHHFNKNVLLTLII